jgi:sugar (pentulose or hexulose) kinase
VDHAGLAELALESVPGAHGLTLLPYLDGERTPNLPQGRGVLLGLTRHNLERGQLMRAAMEGVTLGLNYGLQRLDALGIKPKEIRLTGGGAKSAAWRQIMADVFGVPVVKMVEDEGAALGGALQAAWCADLRAGKKTSLAALCAKAVAVDEKTRCVPDRPRHSVYCALQEKHDKLAATLRPFFT